ncbi:SDR family oxidoreductase [Legionella jordanis]|uniref:Acetyoacetyl CoA reductase n=1 Tax=Legionella jordanis TaxID=456 RepID=A0A0W0VD64_9GAMM|nr:SDR family oxidoreductase [Legionella jordanis]KTD18069.1 acetyoacetyl CoA reductase [Legionella jordanis]RMX02245.1 SDR family oxidoreductase [Legionella jordanis]RMX21269.1 SDR family oxidoreductase [Legionella jordanis]VEH13839.1 3-oxoacyl-[acyl-carrier-protein] reductase [Legionella jordanis]HAT8714220.1 SDR family oxidoreductase [Legionella jordanis]
MPHGKQQQPPQHQAKQPGIEAFMHPKPEYISPQYKGSDKLLGKKALITGGDSGIGRAVACAFALEGADVVIQYLNTEQQDAEETKEFIENAGRKCWLLPSPLDSYEVCEQLVKRALEACSHINILVNNAAEQHPKGSVDEISPEQLEQTFRTNFFAYFYMVKSLLPHMEKGDVIINTTSVTAYKGSEHLIDYSATKGAILAFTRSLSQNLISKGIRVNGVAPGPIWTPLIPASFTADEVEEFGSQVPMSRAGQPSEVAPSYVFLASADSSYMTGQVLHPNGGVIVNS